MTQLAGALPSVRPEDVLTGGVLMDEINLTLIPGSRCLFLFVSLPGLFGGGEGGGVRWGRYFFPVSKGGGRCGGAGREFSQFLSFWGRGGGVRKAARRILLHRRRCSGLPPLDFLVCAARSASAGISVVGLPFGSPLTSICLRVVVVFPGWFQSEPVTCWTSIFYFIFSRLRRSNWKRIHLRTATRPPKQKPTSHARLPTPAASLARALASARSRTGQLLEAIRPQNLNLALATRSFDASRAARHEERPGLPGGVGWGGCRLGPSTCLVGVGGVGLGGVGLGFRSGFRKTPAVPAWCASPLSLAFAQNSNRIW